MFTEIENLRKQLQAARAELQRLKKAERLAKLKSALKVDPYDAEAVRAAERMNEALAALSDDAFELHIRTWAKFSPAPPPPKSTPAPLPPKQTNLPAPATEVGSGNESLRLSIASLFGTAAIDPDPSVTTLF